ncbi:hypothetical protein B0I35DRAFT_416710 [Stachybotrys elegans]|uniref:Myb-like domain-containing protein n=1 Tax=Stachybotrys elegans TaxID=80388 RepID=A0A8K0WX63_9HYPO|nr:hypothetical protein B0I35DRAFT_416710 [Stachybotrys elegans]
MSSELGYPAEDTENTREDDISDPEQGLEPAPVPVPVPVPVLQQLVTDDPSQSQRHVSPGEGSPLKRSAEEVDGREAETRPFKRTKGFMSTDYLDLLNTTIDEAADHTRLEEDDFEPTASYIGQTLWSSAEKKAFYEAVARRGTHDLPGIASKVGKSEIEVHHLIQVLKDDVRSRRQKSDRRAIVSMFDIPAAVELSQLYCHAEEEAADAISVRQEKREQEREQDKWGKDGWDITADVAFRQRAEKEAMDTKDRGFSELFQLSSWLEVSDRMFMNSAVPSNNWMMVDDQPPSIWATALDDFYSLAVSITRRLVQTTLFISSRRISATIHHRPNTKFVVHKSDADAAIASLGMSPNSRRFWMESARRLRLNVYNDEDEDEASTEPMPMDYDDVERELKCDEEAEEEAGMETADESQPGMDNTDDNAIDEGIGGSLNLDEVHSLSGSDSDESRFLGDYDAYLNQETNEVLQFSVIDFPDTKRAKDALQARIRVERREEHHADLVDQFASCEAEADMWKILDRPPPTALPRKPAPAPLSSSLLDVAGIYDTGEEWEKKTHYYGEWETLPQRARREG